jgi:hypothetical protein
MLRIALLSILTLALASTASFVHAADVPDLSGRYDCVGTNPGGGTYRGTVTISRRGETYLVTWVIGQGETYKGLGIVQEKVLAVGYFGGFNGVVAYKIEPSGKLVGKWAVVGESGKVFTETLSPQT